MKNYQNKSCQLYLPIDYFPKYNIILLAVISAAGQITIKNRRYKSIKTLKPFWIYWGVLVFGCIVFFLYPLLFIVFLPMLLFLIPLWIIVVYLIGNAVQRNSQSPDIRKRIFLSFFCSLFTVLIFPVGAWIYDIIRWNKFYFDSFLRNFTDKSFWIIFIIHFFVFWIGEESKHWTSPEKDSDVL